MTIQQTAPESKIAIEHAMSHLLGLGSAYMFKQSRVEDTAEAMYALFNTNELALNGKLHIDHQTFISAFVEVYMRDTHTSESHQNSTSDDEKKLEHARQLARVRQQKHRAKKKNQESTNH